MPKGKKPVFSKVKAAKSLSRATVGTPPRERVVPDTASQRRAAPRFRRTLADILHSGQAEREHEEIE